MHKFSYRFIFAGVFSCFSIGSLPRIGAAPSGEAAAIIAQLHMEKIPVEGPWFTVTYHSEDILPAESLPERYHRVPHVAGTAIYALETKEDFSALHLLQTDEIWHYYGGGPLELLLLYPDGHGETVILGPDILKGQHPQFVVPRGVWQGSKPIGPGSNAYTFFGNTLGPGFEYADFAIGYRDELQKSYPKFAGQITGLTREEFVKRPPQAVVEEKKPNSTVAEKTIFTPAEVSEIKISSGIALRELIGREAKSKADTYSVALFTLGPGEGMPTSYNKVSEESFLIVSGRGEVALDDKMESVTAGGTVIVKPKVSHSIKASPGSPLTFYAISVPAYSRDDYVLVTPAGK